MEIIDKIMHLSKNCVFSLFINPNNENHENDRNSKECTDISNK